MKSKTQIRSNVQIIYYLIIILYVLVACKHIHSDWFNFHGEAASYMLPTISILEHGSMIIQESDIERAAEVYPEFYGAFVERVDTFVKTRTGDLNPYYFCTYSIACIPLMFVLKYIGLPQCLTFQFTNLFLVIFSGLFVMKKLGKTDIQKILILLLIFINPVFYYISWQSAEVFIYAILLITIAYFINKEYKRAAFWLSVAGTLNITVMFFGFVMIADFFINLYRESEENKIAVLIKNNLVKIIQYGCCFLPVFIPMIHNAMYVGEANSTFVMFQIEGTLGRFWSYLIDLNLGIFSYMPCLIILIITVSVQAIKENTYRCFSLICSFLGVVMMFSLASHINSGAQGISRYGAWSNAFIILFAASYFPYEKIKSVITITLFSSSLVCSALLINLASYTTCLQLSLVSRKVLDYAPQLYNPLYSTFNSRVNGREGGYDYRECTPVIYRDDNACIRKVLLTGNQIEEFINCLEGSSEGIEYCKNELEKYSDKNEHFYLNIPVQYQVYSNYSDIQKSFERETMIVDDSTEYTVEMNNAYAIVIDTYYEVEINYESEDANQELLRGDFFGGVTYDSLEQEDTFETYLRSGEGVYSAKCLLFSGNIELATADTVVRVINYSDEPIKVQKVTVYKMQSINTIE